MKSKLMYILWGLFLSTLLSVSCSKDLGNSPPRTQREYVDRYHIVRDYLNNIESMRLSQLYTQDSLLNIKYRNYFHYPQLWGFNDYIWDQTEVRKNNQYDFPNLLKDPIHNSIKIYVENLLYSSDSLLCAGLIVVEYPYRERGENGKVYTYYDGTLLMGYRQEVNRKFDIYVYSGSLIVKQTSRKGMSRNLREMFGIASWDLPYSIFDERFFTIPTFFGKNKDGDYNFQHYYHPSRYGNEFSGRMFLYSNDKERKFHLPQDTVFIPYRY